MTFTKMQGIGNDFVMLDAIRDPMPVDELGDLALRVCDRRRGIGADGLILLEAGEMAPLRMRMLNPDGTESEMCGNGIRCLAKLAADHGHIGEARTGPDASVEIETGAGVLTVARAGEDRFRVDMGLARLTRAAIPMEGAAEDTFIEQEITLNGTSYLATAISMGNPHLVIFLDEPEKFDLATMGPLIENSPVFPNRVNVHIAGVRSRATLTQRTWERGAGLTSACGTGACAVAVAGFLTHRSDSTVEVQLPGGNLLIEIEPDLHVSMTGPAETVFEGFWVDLD